MGVRAQAWAGDLTIATSVILRHDAHKHDWRLPDIEVLIQRAFLHGREGSLSESSAVSATKILWGQITVVVLIVLATTWAATQWTAWRLGFQPQLGQPWFQIVPGMPVYLPLAFFWWWYAYDAYAPRIFLEGASIAASGGLLSLVVAIDAPSRKILGA